MELSFWEMSSPMNLHQKNWCLLRNGWFKLQTWPVSPFISKVKSWNPCASKVQVMLDKKLKTSQWPSWMALMVSFYHMRLQWVVSPLKPLCFSRKLSVRLSKSLTTSRPSKMQEIQPKKRNKRHIQLMYLLQQLLKSHLTTTMLTWWFAWLRLGLLLAHWWDRNQSRSCLPALNSAMWCANLTAPEVSLATKCPSFCVSQR